MTYEKWNPGDPDRRMHKTELASITDRLHSMQFDLGILNENVKNMQTNKNTVHSQILEILNSHDKILHGVDGGPGVISRQNNFDSLLEDVRAHARLDVWLFTGLYGFCTALLLLIIFKH